MPMEKNYDFIHKSLKKSKILKAKTSGKFISAPSKISLLLIMSYASSLQVVKFGEKSIWEIILN